MFFLMETELESILDPYATILSLRNILSCMLIIQLSGGVNSPGIGKGSRTIVEVHATIDVVVVTSCITRRSKGIIVSKVSMAVVAVVLIAPEKFR